jgi:molybdenum cofactor cytidylyltransferase
MYDCVIPAAGASSRMRRADGRASLKPLLPFGGSTLVETAVRAALDCGARVLLVVGNRGEDVVALFAAPAYREFRAEGLLRPIENARWEEGMLVSIQTALPEVEGEAFFVSHADMPFVSPDSYRALAAAWAAREAAGLSEAAMVASHGGRAGHPVLMPAAWIPGILDLRADDSMRIFLQGRPRVAVEMGPGALRDVDTPEDYRRALAGDL